jgi:hypothetical protein
MIAPGYARVLFPAQKITNLQINEARKALKLTGLTGSDEVKARLRQIKKDFDEFLKLQEELLGNQPVRMKDIKKYRIIRGKLIEVK